MKKIVSVIIAIMIFSVSSLCFAQEKEDFSDRSSNELLASDSSKIEWQSCLGRHSSDSFGNVQKTNDGGLIVVGSTSMHTAGGSDVYLIKTDAYGKKQWEKTYGGKYNDAGINVTQTKDGGYIICGSKGVSESFLSYAYLVKVDALGNSEWETTFGTGSGDDFFMDAVEADDGTYIIGGGINGKTGCMVKYNSDGYIVWSNVFPTRGEFSGLCHMRKTSDNGYIFVGYSYLNKRNSIYLIKTNSNGTKLWEKTISSSYGNAVGTDIQQTNDGGFIICGDSVYSTRGADFALTKTDSDGNVIWNRYWGNNALDWASSVKQTSDSGYIAVGQISDMGTYIVRTDEKGNEKWTQLANNYGNLSSVLLADDGGFIFGGDGGGIVLTKQY